MLDETLIELTADIVSAHVANNNVATGDVPKLIHSVFGALSGAARPAEPEAPRPEPAVSIRASVKPDYIVCLEDGKKLKMLKRHLRVHYDLTPEAYRAKWDLPLDYPMVAPNYAETRKALAHRIGLGRGKVAKTETDASDTPKPDAEGMIEAIAPTAPLAEKPTRKPRVKKIPDTASTDL